MLGPKTDNTISDGDGNIQIGQNSGTVHNGIPVELFVAEMRRKDADILRLISEKDALKDSLHADALARKDLETELAELRSQRDGLLTRLENPAQSYAEHIQRGSQIEQLLHDTAVLQTIGENRIRSALEAFADLRYEEIDELLADIENRGLIIAANAAFGRGLIAEDAVKWQDAATHYTKAARLNPTFETLTKASEFTKLSGDYSAALRLAEGLLEIAGNDADRARHSFALSEYVQILTAMGNYA